MRTGAAIPHIVVPPHLKRVHFVRHAQALPAPDGVADQRRQLAPEGVKHNEGIKGALLTIYGTQRRLREAFGVLISTGVDRADDTCRALAGEPQHFVPFGYPDPDVTPLNRYYEDHLYSKLKANSVGAYEELDASIEDRDAVRTVARQALGASFGVIGNAEAFAHFGHGTTSEAMAIEVLKAWNACELLIEDLRDLVLKPGEILVIERNGGGSVMMQFALDD